eukprot:GHVH01004621.1.p2 GENE.GHVH01004621.1~~GHVH01004621.1.p2  ORF type:complete len:123 (+),score=17.16 GHVH01004621.1:124-492(+)
MRFVFVLSLLLSFANGGVVPQEIDYSKAHEANSQLRGDVRRLQASEEEMMRERQMQQQRERQNQQRQNQERQRRSQQQRDMQSREDSQGARKVRRDSMVNNKQYAEGRPVTPMNSMEKQPRK